MGELNEDKLTGSSGPSEFSDLEWLKVQEELKRIEDLKEPYPKKVMRLCKENPFVPFGLYDFYKRDFPLSLFTNGLFWLWS